MIDFDKVRKAFVNTVLAEMSIRQPGIPLAWDNQRFEQPEGPWVQISIIPNKTKRAELSSAGRYNSWGVVNAVVLVPQDTGSKILNDIATSLFTILADRNWELPESGYLTTYCCDQKDRGIINGFRTRNVVCEYRYADRMTR